MLAIMVEQKSFSLDGWHDSDTLKASSLLSSVGQQQLPITPVYASTDYRSQAQTINHCIIDLATPPSGQLTPSTP